MARQLLIEVIGDDRSYLRAAQRTVATNTKLRTSFAQVGLSAEKSAAVTAAAAVKSQAVQRERLAATTRFALTAPTPQLKEAAFAQAATQQARLDKELGNVQKATRGSALATAAYGTSVGRTTRETEALSQRTAVAERDLGKIVRGGLAGSGVFSKLGRSLAFASSGFIAVSVGAAGVAKSITSAETLEKAQRSLGAAIQHTGGRLKELLPEYVATAKAAARFGVTQADATTGEARATVITGNAAAAQRAYQEALVISKATGKDFNSVLIATSKGQEGIVTSLRRYGILVDATTKGTRQFALVMRRFGGQAAANTTELEKLGATATNTLAAIGTELLPTVNRLAASFAAWLTQMQKSGRLQKDVNDVMHVTGDVFHALGEIIGTVDKVTGGFANTLKALVAFRIASVVAGWIGPLKALTLQWGAVRTAAIEANTAETAGFTRGIVGGPGSVKSAPAPSGGSTVGGPLSFLLGASAARALRGGSNKDAIDRIAKYTGTVAKSGTTAAETGGRFALLATKLRGLSGSLLGLLILPQEIQALAKTLHNVTHPDTGDVRSPKSQLGSFTVNDQFFPVTKAGKLLIAQVGGGEKAMTATAALAQKFGVSLKQLNKGIESVLQSVAVITPQLRTFVKTQNLIPPAFRVPGLTPPQSKPLAPLPGTTAPPPPFGGAKPIPVFKTFQLTAPENLAQARAALTKSNADDVAAAKAVIARIKRLIDHGHLAGKSLIQALQAEASALGTIWSSEDAAAQKRAAAAQAAKARIQAQIENSIDPLKLEVALSQAQAQGRPFVSILKQLRASAEAALRSGKLTLAQQKEAWDQITQLNGQIKDALTAASVTFQVPAKLALALAKDQALGRDDTRDLLKLKRAILNFIKHHQHNIAALTDAYNQLAAINQQLGSTAASALGLFKQASTKALTAGLDLTAQQRKALRERLAGLGPGGTVSGSGVGAAGFAIDPNTGRPISLDRHHRRRSTSDGGGGGTPIKVDNRIDLNVYIDGRQVEASVTKRQQKRKRRNPSQRRGPNAGG